MKKMDLWFQGRWRRLCEVRGQCYGRVARGSGLERARDDGRWASWGWRNQILLESVWMRREQDRSMDHEWGKVKNLVSSISPPIYVFKNFEGLTQFEWPSLSTIDGWRYPNAIELDLTNVATMVALQQTIPVLHFWMFDPTTWRCPLPCFPVNCLLHRHLSRTRHPMPKVRWVKWTLMR
jgi:hypothetical protein